MARLRLPASLLLLASAFLAARFLVAPIDPAIPVRWDPPSREAALDRYVAACRPGALLAASLAGLGLLVAPLAPRKLSRKTGRRIAWAAAAGLTANAAWIATSRLDRLPHIFDAFNYLFQAKNFALLQLAATPPPFVANFTQIFFVVHGGHWYGSSLPGHPLMLALGVVAGLPWLVNPISAGLTLLLLHRFLERLFGPAPALAGGLLFALSPFVHLLSASMMAHATALLCCMAFLHFFTSFLEEGRPPAGLLAGAAFGLGFITRPQALLPWALPLLVFALSRLKTSPLGKKILSSVIILALPAIPFLLFELHYNHELTGEWLNTPRSIVSPSHRLGFGKDVGRETQGGHTGHTVAKGIANSKTNFRLLGRDLFGWFGLSLLLVPFALPALRGLPLVALGAVLLNTGIYFAYFTASPLLGPRYFYEIIPAFIILTIAGGRVLARATGNRPAIRRGIRRGTLRGTLGFFSMLTLLSLGWFEPARLARYQPPRADAIRTALYRLPAGKAIVFLPPYYFSSNGQAFNSPNLDNEVLLAADLGLRKNQALLDAMPERTAYRFHYDEEADTGTIVPYARDHLRLLIVGIDSATWDVMNPMLARGELPTFQRLMREGVSGPLATLSPTISAAIWTSIATGVKPEKHGITAFVDPGEHLITSSNRRRVAALWDMVNSRGFRANVLSYWCTWPAEPIDGLLLSDRATTPGLAAVMEPRRLRRKILSMLGQNRRTVSSLALKSQSHAGVDEERLLRTTLFILDHEPAALTMVYFRRLDILQHRFWKFYDPEGFDVAREQLAKFGNVIPDAYRRYDRYLKKLLEALPDDATILVLSDHGMESAKKEAEGKVFRTNVLLQRLGLLNQTSPGVPAKKQSQAISRAAPIHDLIDVRVTASGRKEEVAGRLLALRRDGEPLLLPAGEEGSMLHFRLKHPDTPATGTIEGTSIRLDSIIADRAIHVSGLHDRPLPGIIIASGPKLRRGTKLSQASVLDIVPTALAILGLPPPEAGDGRILTEAFAVPPPPRDPVPYRRLHASPKVKLPEQTAAKTKQELRSLGYLP